MWCATVWSFGVVLWELATGLEPWAEQSAVQVVGAVGFGGATLDIPPSTNSGLADIIRSCWQEPHLRPSFDDLITSIRVSAPPMALKPSPKVWKKISGRAMPLLFQTLTSRSPWFLQ